MIGTIDVNVQAAKPGFPLAPVRAFVSSPSSFRIRNVPRRIGSWDITGVRPTVNYPDGTTVAADAALVGGVWVGTVPGCDTPGTSANGFIVYADGVDERGEDVTGYVLGVGDVEILNRENAVTPETQTFKGDPGAPGADGDTPVIGDNGNWWIGGIDTGKPARGPKGETGETPDVVAPSESATTGQAADAKATYEALTGKLDKSGGTVTGDINIEAPEPILNVSASRTNYATLYVKNRAHTIRITSGVEDGASVEPPKIEIDGVPVALTSDIADATKLTPVLDADGRVTGYKLGDKASPVLLSDDAKAALFAGAVISSTTTELTNMACSVVPFADGMTITFAASTGLRQCEVLITGCTAGAALNVTATKLRGDADALTLEAGDNHLTFAEYATGEFFVTRHLANEI